MNIRLFFFAIAGGALLLSWCASFVLWRAAERGDELIQLEPREFGALEVVAIGTGTAYENPTRRGPCIAVGAGESLWLIDAGRGIAEGLRAAAIPVVQPSTVLLTSLLPENTTGLDDLLMTGFRQGRSQPLRLIGPPGTQAFASALEQAQAVAAAALVDHLALSAAGATFEVLEAYGDFREEHGPVTLTAGEIPGGPLPGLAWSFQRKAHRVVIAGTGWGVDELVEFADSASLLVHEAVFIPTAEDAENAGIELNLAPLDRERPLHISINDIGPIAQRAHVRALALVRLRPPPFYDIRYKTIVGRRYDGKVLIPEDSEDIWP
jgi:ribonuclease Z